MHDNLGPLPGVPGPPLNPPPNPFGNTFYGAGSGLIQGGLGAYGGKLFGSGSDYVQSNVSCKLLQHQRGAKVKSWYYAW